MENNEFIPDAEEELYEAAADKIIEKMRKVRNDVKSYERSWIWELIQNAKDNVAGDFPNQKVSIKLEVTSTNLLFSHNYGYFTWRNVTGIVRQVNKKDIKNDDETTNKPIIIGRFGTGFMTTHLLSKKIDVKALYFKNNTFKKFVEFPIDRTDIEKDFLVSSIRNSFEIAQNSVNNAVSLPKENIDFSDYNSVFSYQLDENAQKTAQVGINDLFHSLPYTLVFVDGIEKVIIDNLGVSTSFVKVEREPLSSNVNLVHISKTTQNQIETLVFAYLKKSVKRKYKGKEIDVDVKIALPLQSNASTYNILSIQKNLPFIFLDFPLIGTENFYFPIIINFPLFEPTEPRDGVYLEEQGEESLANQEIFKVSLELIIGLTDFAVANKWSNLYNLAKTDLPEERKGFSKTWFRANIQKPIRTHLLKSEIVQTETSRILLENALFPYAAESRIEKVWHLAKVLHKDKLPKLEHIHEWHKIIDNDWGKDLRYDLKKMVIEIASHSSITNLMSRVGLGEQETLSWLNSVIEFVVSEDEKLLTDYAIIPNQYGDFKKKENLWADESVSEELKDVLKILQDDWRLNLRHKSIPAYQPTTKKGIDDIVSRINIIIKTNSVPTIKTAVLDLLSCFPSSNELPKERNEFWNFAKNFYSNTPDKKGLENWTKSVAVWEECDKWFMKNLIYDISQYQNTSRLTTYLNSDSLAWLHKFINFVSEQQLETHLNNYAILPNQKGDFKKKTELSVEDEDKIFHKLIGDTLKDILELLGYDCRAELLATEIALSIDGKTQTTKEIAQKITEKVQQLLREEGLKHRQESTKQVFSKLLLWFHENEPQAEEYFADLYEKRHRLRSDDEIITDIKFRQSLLSNSNGYSEKEILELVNTPKEILLTAVQLSKNDLKGLLANREEFILQEAEKIKKQRKEIKDEMELIAAGVTSLELIPDLNKASTTLFFENATFTSGGWDYVKSIISRAVQRVLEYLMKNPRYKFSNDIGVLMISAQTPTVITGVFKDEQPINLVIRPSDGQKVHVYYGAEFKTLLLENTEFWIDNGYDTPELLTIGKILQYTETEIIPLYAKRLK
jgi:hypothetical protein